VSDWNAKIIPDDDCDDTLENDEAVTEVDFWKYSIFILGRSTNFETGGWQPSDILFTN
jgi:hypothetical protein